MRRGRGREEVGLFGLPPSSPAERSHLLRRCEGRPVASHIRSGRQPDPTPPALFSFRLRLRGSHLHAEAASTVKKQVLALSPRCNQLKELPCPRTLGQSVHLALNCTSGLETGRSAQVTPLSESPSAPCSHHAPLGSPRCPLAACPANPKDVDESRLREGNDLENAHTPGGAGGRVRAQRPQAARGA